MLYTTREAADYLQLSRSYVTVLMKRGEIKAKKDIFGQWQVEKSELTRYKSKRSNRSIPSELKIPLTHFICDILEKRGS